MLDFSFKNPTKIVFGKDSIAKLSEEIPKGKKVLVLYGGGSIKKNGTYDQVIKALEGYTVEEFSGIEPNPSYTTCCKAVAFIKEKNLDFILAVGGGSVIDAAKFIAAAYYVKDGQDPWEIVAGTATVSEALPIGTVLTLPATGSEMNGNSVITRYETKQKFYFNSPKVYPAFSVLDPTKTFTLPTAQVANGVIDAFVHVMEQYCTYDVNSPLQDRFSESILKTLVEEGIKVMKNPDDYDTRANIMLCATMALNGLIAVGVPQDWATHNIGHEITAHYGLDHGVTLAIVLPSLLNVMRNSKRDKIIQYGERIFGITQGSEDERINATIEATRSFFEQLGVKTHLKDYNIGAEAVDVIVKSLEDHLRLALGEKEDITLDVSRKILEGCL